MKPELVVLRQQSVILATHADMRMSRGCYPLGLFRLLLLLRCFIFRATGYPSNLVGRSGNMFEARIFLSLVIPTILLCGSVRAGVDEAWQALHRLEADRAVELFEEALGATPTNHAIKRGLILAHYFNGHYEPQLELILEAIRDDPDNPYGLALFEHLAAELTSISGCLDVERAIGEILMDLPPGSMRFCGHTVYESWAEATVENLPDDWSLRCGKAPGAWIAGPFENESKLTTVRLMPGELTRLDTTAGFTGEDGTKIEWQWLGGNWSTDFTPQSAMEIESAAAALMKFPFKLQRDMEVVIVVGGGIHHRVRVDGQKLLEDRIIRNSVIRDAMRTSLTAGEHELTFAFGYGNFTTSVSVWILDTLYQPVDGLEWTRYASWEPSQEIKAVPFHPIFDVFRDYIAVEDSCPDTRYWWSVLQIYNGRSTEAVRELEELEASGELSVLESWILFRALQINNESEKAAVVLSKIMEVAETPLTELAWLNASDNDYESNIRLAADLSQKYPDRPDLAAFTTLGPILTGDFAGFLAAADSFATKYPYYAGIHSLKALMSQQLGDRESVLNEMIRFYEKTGGRKAMYSDIPQYYVSAKKYDEAIEMARSAFEAMPTSDDAVFTYISSLEAANRLDDALDLLDSLHSARPANLEFLSWLHYFYNKTGRHSESIAVLKEIHRRKPTAWSPHISLDSLHNNVPYDSIFTGFDVTSIWDESPTEYQLSGEGRYYLMDRVQTIVFESGVALQDYHSATVLLDKASVESLQESYIGFSPESSVSNLLVARRLRNGEPPVAGQHQGEYVVFRDLQPGDAVEFRHRNWTYTGGDLWNHFWDSYIVGSDCHQRYWEYVVLTNRADLSYGSANFTEDPVTDIHCGFKRISWKGEHTQAIDSDPIMLPPYSDLMGRIYVSTLSDWEEIASWYESISEAILDDNPRAEILAREIASGASDDAEKLRLLYEKVVLDIPYQVIGFNYDASVPHSPDEVLLNRWGDCKDKSHLLIHMLRTSGIDAWPILVMSRSEGTGLPIPYIGFDHLILGCIINGDTVYVDPSSMPYAPEHSVDYSIAGQPCLHIGAHSVGDVGRIPAPSPTESSQEWYLKLSPGDNGNYRFLLKRDFHNLDAGYYRAYYEDKSNSDLIKDKESYYSDAWSTTLTVDSLGYDSVQTVSPVFTDWWSGEMKLTIQSLGNTVFVGLPPRQFFAKSILPELSGHGERTFPVDLRDLCGVTKKSLEVTIPVEFDEPVLHDPVELSDSLLNFSYDFEWHPDTRQLLLVYEMTIEDGCVSLDIFQSFIEQVIEISESPLLLTVK